MSSFSTLRLPLAGVVTTGLTLGCISDSLKVILYVLVLGFSATLSEAVDEVFGITVASVAVRVFKESSRVKISTQYESS